MPLTPPFTMSAVAKRLYDQLEPLAYADESHGWPLAHFCEAFIGGLQEVEDYSRDYLSGGVEKIGWSKLFDLNLIPDDAVRWLAQFVGVYEPKQFNETEAAYVARLKPFILERIGWSRGTPGAIIEKVKDTLTGTKTVYLTERQGSAYTMAVATWASETPNTDVTTNAALSQKPAGIIMNVSTLVGGDFLTLRNTHTDFADVLATFTDFLDVRTDPSQI